MIDYQAKLKELQEILEGIKLVKDPVSVGLDYFNEKFYEVQASRDRVLSLLIEAIWNRASLNSELSMLKAEYEKKLAEILVRDEVKCLKSNELRLAVANKELENLVSEIKKKEVEVEIAEAYYKTIVVCYEELKSKNENLAQQFLTVRAMLNIEPSLKDSLIKVTTK